MRIRCQQTGLNPTSIHLLNITKAFVAHGNWVQSQQHMRCTHQNRRFSYSGSSVPMCRLGNKGWTNKANRIIWHGLLSLSYSHTTRVWVNQGCEMYSTHHIKCTNSTRKSSVCEAKAFVYTNLKFVWIVFAYMKCAAGTFYVHGFVVYISQAWNHLNSICRNAFTWLRLWCTINDFSVAECHSHCF